MHLRNKDQQDALFVWIYFNNYSLPVPKALTLHYQEVVCFICNIWYLSYIYVG